MAESTKPGPGVNWGYARERRLAGRLADPGSIPGASTTINAQPCMRLGIFLVVPRNRGFVRIVARGRFKRDARRGIQHDHQCCGRASPVIVPSGNGETYGSDQYKELARNSWRTYIRVWP